jgi:hypothetical protein
MGENKEQIRGNVSIKLRMTAAKKIKIYYGKIWLHSEVANFNNLFSCSVKNFK